MRHFKTILDKGLEYVIGIVLGILVFAVTWQVLARYIFQISTPWTEELAMFLMIWLSLLGASVAYRRRAHLGIDAIVICLSLKVQRLLEMVVHSLVIIFAVLVMLIGGTMLVRNTFLTHQTSAAMGVRMGYIYLALPVSGFFLIIDGIEFLIDSCKMRNRQPNEPSTSTIHDT